MSLVIGTLIKGTFGSQRVAYQLYESRAGLNILLDATSAFIRLQRDVDNVVTSARFVFRSKK